MARDAQNTPPGECPQCWEHANNSRVVHRGLGPREDCPKCVDHMENGCPYLTPKKESFWW
ncbi:pRL2-8 [Streptomyces sp. NPDC046821]|uniref:pRL2-8 n=1 Tax=Streptomyces sp. NPDC046821 TaxID=3154702 RepID=UPI0033C2132B